MAAVRQLAGERKGLGSGAQSARQANSLLANLQPRAWTAPPSPPPPPPPPPRFVWWVRRRRRRRSRCRAWRSAGRLRPPAPMVQWADEKRPSAPSEAPRSPRFQNPARAILGALFPPLKAPQRDVRATTRRHSAAVCPRDGPATPIARPRANNILSHTARQTYHSSAAAPSLAAAAPAAAGSPRPPPAPTGCA